MGDMRYRRLGNSGLAVSVVGLGGNNFGRRVDVEGTKAILEAALDAGINFVDTADIYGSPRGAGEETLGAAMALLGCRDNLVIATKFGHRAPDPVNGPDWGARSGRRYIMRAVEASLRRLRTDYIDLYQIHQPDPDTPVEETLSALNDLVRAGKVRYLGCSQFAGWQVADAAWTAHTAHLTPFVSAQNEYSLLRRDVETELVPACARFGLGLLPFFPLASGLLTGKYRRGEAPAAGTRMSDAAWRDFYANAPWDTIEKVAEFARQRDRSPIDVAIGGLAAKPAVASVIAGATSPAQVRANAGAVTWQPTESELAELDAITAR